MTENANIKWYALKVTANQERKVKEYIDKKLRIENLTAWVPKVVVPTEKYLAVDINGKKSVRERLILPGYLLVNADLGHGEVRPILRGVSGVFGFLSMTEGRMTDIPAPLRQREVDRFLKVYEEQEELSWTPSFKVGDTVRILEGAFASFEAVVQRCDVPKMSVSVLVTIFGRETPIDLIVAHVEKVQHKVKEAAH